MTIHVGTTPNSSTEPYVLGTGINTECKSESVHAGVCVTRPTYPAQDNESTESAQDWHRQEYIFKGVYTG